MLKNERLREIIHHLEMKDGIASVQELCRELYASESSIRRDLTLLEEKSILKRTHGGAELIKSHSNVVAFSQRARHNATAKHMIAQKAAGLIGEGSVIFLDQSSTTMYLANEIKDRKGLTVVTNGIEIMRLLAETKIKVISSGGVLSGENRVCLVGTEAQKTFESINADLVFFSAKSLSEDGVISDCTREEVLVRHPMLKHAEKKVLLCAGEKFNTQSPYIQCTLSEIDYLVSENEDAKQFQGRYPRLTVL